MSVDAIIAIGHDGADSPELFNAEVATLLADHATINASIGGIAGSIEYGREPSRWWAVTIPTVAAERAIRARLRQIAKRHNQDSIALTTGYTSFLYARDADDAE